MTCRNNYSTLAEEIDQTVVRCGEMAFWWLGQHSFAIKFSSGLIYVDPYLSDSSARNIPPLLPPHKIGNPLFILGTHNHSDHIDKPVWEIIASHSSATYFVVPEKFRYLLSQELQISLDRFIGLNDGMSFEMAGIRVTGIGAAHELLDIDPITGLHSFLGYVIECDGIAVYHAGDTCIYEGLQTKLKRWQFDVIFLPINGRDAERLRRNCIGNMTYQEAADLAGVLSPRLTIPAHFDMFRGNSEDPQKFVDYMNVKYPALETMICKHGKIVRIGKRKNE